MCDLCVSFGLATEAPKSRETAAETEKSGPELTNNGDGTYTLRLTERQLTNLTVRLALSVARGL